MSRAFIKLIEILGGLVAGVAIAGALLFWRLNEGPISLDVLTPYLERALSADDRGMRAKIGATQLIWAGWDRAVDLRTRDVQALGPDGGVLLSLPEVSVRLSMVALARGEIRPTEIELLRPRLRLTRREDGQVDLGFGDSGDEEQLSSPLLESVLDDLSGPRRSDVSAGLLDRLVVADADLAVTDLAEGVLWRATGVDLRFERSPDGLRVRLTGDAEIGGYKTRIDGAGRYLRETGLIETQFQLTKFDPAALSMRVPEAKRARLLLDGVLLATFDRRGKILSARLEAAAGAGSLSLPEFYPGDLAVTAAQIRARYDHAADSVELERLVVDLGGPVLRATARLTGLGERGLVEAEATVEGMEADRLAAFWPAGLGKNARTWVTQNISAGTVREARIKLTGELRDLDAFTVRSVAGGLAYENLSVRYLSPMPAVRGVRGTATFSESRFDLAITGGTLDALRVGPSTVALTGLDNDRERADIEVVITGPVKDAIRLIDSKPLGYASKIGLGLDGIAGDAAIRLRLAFPLSSNLKMEQVAVSTAANLRGVTVPKVIRGWDVTEAKGALALDGRGMTIKGDGKLQGSPVSFEWRENFDDAPAVRRRFDVTGRIDDAGRRALALPLQDKASGPIGAVVVAEQRPNGASDIEVRLDLASAQVQFEEIAWKKAAGKPATAKFFLRLDRDRLHTLDRLEASADDLDLRGRIEFDREGEITLMDLPRLKVGASTVDVKVGRAQPRGYDVRIEGPVLDLRPLFDSEGQVPQPKKAGPPLAVRMAVEQLRLSDDRAFSAVRASLNSDGTRWQTIGAEGRVGTEGQFALNMTAAAGDRHAFQLTSRDAGAMLRALNFYDNVIGGQLLLKGTVDVEGKGLPFEGDLEISDFQVVKAPILARLATLASFSGLVETLSGSGIGFSKLTAKLSQDERRLVIADALAAGAVGITVHGWIERKTDVAELEGTAVPAYAINRVIGAIPLLGALITGGQNEGIVAADFRISGPLDSPEVTVNPLSALAPGFLRRIVRLFSGGGPDTTPEGAAERALPPRTAPSR